MRATNVRGFAAMFEEKTKENSRDQKRYEMPRTTPPAIEILQKGKGKRLHVSRPSPQSDLPRETSSNHGEWYQSRRALRRTGWQTRQWQPEWQNWSGTWEEYELHARYSATPWADPR